MTDTGYLYEYFLANSPKEADKTEDKDETEEEVDYEKQREAG